MKAMIREATVMGPEFERLSVRIFNGEIYTAAAPPAGTRASGPRVRLRRNHERF